MGSQNSKMGESSSRTNRQISSYIESFFNETMESIKEMNKEDDQPYSESDDCVGIAYLEIKSLLRPVLQDDINEENLPKLEAKISKRKVIKAWLKEKFQGNGKDLVTKFFRALRKLRKKYKNMVKKVKNYAKDGSGDIRWKRVTRLIFLIAVIAVLTCSVIAFFVSAPTAPLLLSLAALVLSFFTFLQDWYENQFKEDEKKNRREEESASSELTKLDEKNGGFAAGAEAEFQNITKVMKKFTGGFEELRQEVANSFKRMLEGGRKVIENIK